MLVTIEEAAQKIAKGDCLMVAGDVNTLRQLPKGAWIGGSIPYFISDNGGLFSKEKVFITVIDRALFQEYKVTCYQESTIENIAVDAYGNGATFLILPFGTPVHERYAKDGPAFKDLFLHPIVGWISGIALEEIGKVKPVVVDGTTGQVYEDRAVAIHAALPAGKSATIGIVNIFTQGSGDLLEFEHDGFTVDEVLVNGKKKNFARYLKENAVDTKLPLVGNYSGAGINVSIQAVDEATGKVQLYAPVFKAIHYHIAAPVGNYAASFEKALRPFASEKILFSCNCILNYAYGELEGKKTGTLTGPITFGEIAYQLLNQTLVYLEISQD